MKQRLIQHIRRSKNPQIRNQWSSKPMQSPEEMNMGEQPQQPGKGPKVTGQSLDSFIQDIDMPDDLSVSPLQGNPADPKPPGTPQFGDTFREKLRRRRSKDTNFGQQGGFL